MQVNFELTPDDFWHLSIYNRHHKYRIRLIFVYALLGMMAIVFLVGCWAFVKFWLTFGHAPWSLLISLPILVFFILRLLPPTKSSVIKRVINLEEQRSGLLCHHVIDISPEWLSEKTSVNESKVAWRALKLIGEDSDHLFLFLEKEVHIIPKRAFPSPHEVDIFLSTARRFWEAAKTGQPILYDEGSTWPPPPRIGA